MDMLLFSVLLFGISGGEIFIILLLILIFFGPKRIPEIARTLGKGINEIKKVQKDINTEINRYAEDIDNPVKQVKEDIEGFRKGLTEEEATVADKKNKSTSVEDELPYPYNQISDERDHADDVDKEVDDLKEPDEQDPLKDDPSEPEDPNKSL